MAVASSSRLSFERSIDTPICPSSLAMVEMSISRGTFSSLSGRSESSVAQMIGSAAFFAPDTCTVPCSGRPPAMRSLSTALPLLRRQRLHRQGVDLLAHAVAKGGVDQLVALHAALAGEGARHHHRLEVLPVAEHLEVLAGEPARDSRLHAFRCHHLSLYPDLK